MLSKNQIKYYRSLSAKKNRDQKNVFIAEGPKLVLDLLPYFNVVNLIIEPEYETKFGTHTYTCIPSSDMRKISLQKQPQGVYAIFEKQTTQLSVVDPSHELILMLDNLQDPGNLGTIIRLCDWFGIKHIICSTGSVDCYNPKVVQATMGALGRINLHYTNLQAYLKTVACPVYGTFLEGEILSQTTLSDHGIIVMGNEGNGISKEVEAMVTQKLFIPNYPMGTHHSESLNVATAAAIVCSEFRR